VRDDRTMALPPEDGSVDASDLATVAEGVTVAADAVSAGASPATAAAETPQQVGPYRLVRQIGEGGMGQVYAAEQTEPIRRTVALKMVKRGMDTKEFIARFESERQALAMMDHPCIARVFDAGATDRGRPYFVMEYVDGIPINEYCDTHQLAVKERLKLFVSVCEGVQHAHQKAIIHRDLKPSNVLVTVVDGKPVPKIIDFGVAKATDQSLTDMTMATGMGQLVGTPEYMSPEQADLNGQGIDTRTDVYALGVLLYELLVGQLPFTSEELQKVGFVEVLRKIREDQPPRPSTRVTALGGALAEIAQSRRSEPAALRNQLRGDLDWITMKALEKERERRYETANALAMDITRHLEFKPVRAGPPSTAYRFKKFVRRHRTGVAAGAIVGIAVILGAVGTTIGMIRAVRAEQVASEEAETAQQVSNFLVDLFEVSDPDRARGNTITVREILDQGAQRIEEELEGQPLTQARLMNTIGKVYQNLGLYDAAGPQLETALALRRREYGNDNIDVATSLADLADLYIDQARFADAEAMLQQALAVMGRQLGSDHLSLASSLHKLASVYRREGKYEVAAPLYYRALDLRIVALGAEHPEVAHSYNSLAILHWNQGDYEEAERLYQKALAVWQNAYGTDHADVAKGLNNLALLYHQLERYRESESLYRQAVAIYEKVLGPEHPRLATAVNNLALVAYQQDRHAEAADLYRRALAIREKALGSDHPDVAQTLNNLANLHRTQRRFDDAEPLYRRALDIRERALGGDHPDVAWSLRDLGKLYCDRGDYTAAVPYFRRAVAIFETALGPEHPELADILTDYAEALRELDRIEEAAVQFQRAEAIQSKQPHNG